MEEGIALRASDLDVVYVAGYGFPRYRGGPMFHADLVGLAEVASRMRRFAAAPRADTAFWQPAPLLRATRGGGQDPHGMRAACRRLPASAPALSGGVGVPADLRRPERTLERASIPLRRIGSGRVRAAEEVEQHGIGIRGRANGLVGQQEFSELIAVIRGGGPHLRLSQTRAARDRRRRRTTHPRRVRPARTRRCSPRASRLPA